METIETRKKPWAGWTVSALAALFLLMDAGMKFAKPDFVVKINAELGYSESAIVPIGVVLLVCTILYIIPQTSVLGALLLTGYLGGAVATHARLGNSLFGQVLFPVYIGILLWLGLYLRDKRLRDLVPFRK
jgi:hypothetical protein